MRKTEFIDLLSQYGDAVVTYRSENSHKVKYNIVTTEFDNKYIQQKTNRAKESENTVLVFAWDTDSYRLIKPENITSVVPLSAILKNER